MSEILRTPHIEAKKEDIAKVVLMPGDPLRAKFIAETFLTNAKCFNNVRGMLGYTGEYKGKRISVMGSGMGMPSMGIYSYELFKFFDVDKIIRIGSTGAYKEEHKVYDVLLVDEAWTDSSYGIVQGFTECKDLIKASVELNNELKETAEKLNKKITEVRIHSSDVFYKNDTENVYKKIRDDHGCAGVEMESFALFANAIATGKKAACLLTVSDSLVTKEETTAEERQNSFKDMMEIALELAE